MKYRVLFLSVSLGIMMSSCEDTSGHDGKASVEVLLQAGEGISSIADAEVRLNCMAGNGKARTVIAADNTANGRYVANIPVHYMPAVPFVEISLGERHYSYMPAIDRFEGGRNYLFSFVVGTDGLSRPGVDINTGGWEIVDTEITFD